LWFVPKVTEQHLAARRRQILDAALVRFSRQGFHRTPMQAIFDEAGLSPGAVYRYFNSKEEIVQAIASETLGGFIEAIEADPGDEPLGPGDLVERLLDAVESVGLRTDRLRLAVQIWGEALHNEEIQGFLLETVAKLRARMTADLRDAQERGALDSSIDPDAAARVVLAMAQGYVVQTTWNEQLDRAAFRATAHALLQAA
jgi:TetR/AcrR family transcriptional regulator, transcriptional repressor of aconitase